MAITKYPVRFWENAAFALLIFLHLLPLWVFRFFPTSDGPTHLYNAWLWKAMLLQPSHPAHKILEFNHNFEPNYLSNILFFVLFVVLPPWLAEKTLLSIYVVGLPLALRYLLRAIRPESGWLVILGFPFIYSVVLVWGFYNFCFSLALLLWVLGYWIRCAGSWRPVTVVGLAMLLLVLYAAHPMSYLVSGVMLGLLSVADRPRWAALPRELGILLLAYLPTLPFMGWYFWQKGAVTGQSVAQPYAANLMDWLCLEPIRYFGSAEGTYRWIVVGLFAVAIILAIRRLVQQKAGVYAVLPWILGVGLLLAAYVALPDAVAGGSITRPRWGLTSYLLLLGAIAVAPWSPRTRLVGTAIGAIVAIALLGFRWPKFRAFQAGLLDYAALLPHVRPGSTLLPISYKATLPLPVNFKINTYIPVLSQVINYVAVERQLISYENYEAATGYFPLVWRSGHNPALLSQAPARLAEALYVPAHQPKYILLQNRASAAPNDANAAEINNYLQRFSYRLQYRSPTGALELYESQMKH